MEIIDTIRLANGEMLYLVKIFDELLLLGGTKESISNLKSWDEKDVVLDLTKQNEKNLEGRASEFKNMLLAKLKNKDFYNRAKKNKAADQSKDESQEQESDLDEK